MKRVRRKTTESLTLTILLLASLGAIAAAVPNPKSKIQNPKSEIEVGQPAPDFTLPDQDGKLHHLADYKGKTVILAMYPKDMTPG